jgi:alpha-ketoglutaric semialdehyde dehydrogenase
MRELTGRNIIAGQRSRVPDRTFTGFDPRTGRPQSVRFAEASRLDIDAAVNAAEEAFGALRSATPEDLAHLLETIAEKTEGIAGELIETADSETALGTERLGGECARACAQLRLFATVLRRGDYLEPVIDLANLESKPPRPDLRRMQIAIGPVAVFGASNFPFAFSVLGGDVASALAAGCPVVAKAHPAHPGTSELSASAVVDALQECGLPAGAFSLLQGEDEAVGETLVTRPAIQAVGFTGSLRGGRSLYDLAARRPAPIPFYAEMGSLNPVIVTRGILDDRLDEFARGFVTSMTLSGGQFCTKPGVLIAPLERSEVLLTKLRSLLELTRVTPMLSERVRSGLAEQVVRTLEAPGVGEVARISSAGTVGFTTDLVLVTADDRSFQQTSALMDEHFGAFAVVVTYESDARLLSAAMGLRGSLTATVHCLPDEIETLRPLEAILARKAGRLIWNGFPTGVAVTDAMVHGGPFPATTFAEHTSVGSFAIRRWLRPICFQTYPDALLPAALQAANPLQLRRLVNGAWSSNPA